MEPAIEVRNLTKVFEAKSRDGQSVVAADNISFRVEKGDIFGIIGLSGAGKSTLVRCLNLLEKPSQGEIIIGGKDLMKMKSSELRLARRKIGMIFQHFNLLMQRSVLDNVCFSLEIAGVRRGAAKVRAMELLRTVGLEDKAHAYPAQLSGGQKQRVAIARVLASDPEILLCDEATSALDPQTTKSILALLKEINEKMGLTILLITHEMAVVQEICNYVLVLEKGQLMEQGTVEELFHSPKTEATKRLLVNQGSTYLRTTDGRCVRLTFNELSAKEPVIGNAILKFGMPLNILFANMKELSGKSSGQMIIQLPDEPETAEKMLEYFRSKQIGVEEWTEDVG